LLNQSGGFLTFSLVVDLHYCAIQNVSG
jgi:hypothetical protein